MKKETWSNYKYCLKTSREIKAKHSIESVRGLIKFLGTGFEDALYNKEINGIKFVHKLSRDLKLPISTSRLPNGHWKDFKNVVKEIKSRKITSFTEARNVLPGGFSSAASKLNYRTKLQELFKWEITGSRYRRGIYSIEFPDNSVYIGLTYSFNRRFHDHYENKSSNKYVEAKKYQFDSTWVEWEGFSNSQIEAQEMEQLIFTYYLKKEWTILNLTKTGALGSSIKVWTDTKIISELSKIADRSSSNLKKVYPSLLAVIQKRDLTHLLDEHRKVRKPYSIDELYFIQGFITSMTQFRLEFGGAYEAAVNLSLINELTSHISRKTTNGYLVNKKNHKKHGHWTKENCQEEALKYNYRVEFQDAPSGAYQAALKNEWIDEICSHMNPYPRGSYANLSKKEVIKLASIYDSRTELTKNDMSLYRKCTPEMLDEIFPESAKKPFGYWNDYQNCLNQARISKTYENFIKTGSCINSCRKNNFLNDIKKEMNW